MFKSILKRIIMFFIPFLFINNIYADKSFIVNYRYKTADADYIVTYDFNDDFSRIANITISKYSSLSTGVSEPVEVKELENLIGIDTLLTTYGVTGAIGSYDSYYNKFLFNDGDFISELEANPEKYRPILKFDKNGNPVLIGSYFYSEAFEESYKDYSTLDGSVNLNDYPAEFIEKFLNGDLTPRSQYNIKSLNFYDFLDSSIAVDFVSAKINSVNSSNDSYNVNFTAGTCDGYYKGLKEMRELISGTTSNGKKNDGICSAKSLNAMQSISSLYELENDFDSSVLESNCREMIFGENGYIKRILEAQSFYNALMFKDEKRAQMFSCLSMQGEYLKGFGLLTTFTPITENTNETGCELIGAETINFINDLFDAVKIICTAVCIFLCIMDVYKMVVAKESDITKFKTVLIKRVVALVAVFLLPLVINIITDLINDRYLKSNPSKCSNVIRK